MQYNLESFSHSLSRLLPVLLILLNFIPGRAYNMRRIANSEGMTNSAVLSLCQDSRGLLWIGTCDGVNIYDGLSVFPLSELYPSHQLSGNIIEGFLEGEDGKMWVRTNYGINLFDPKEDNVKVFPKFKGRDMLRKNHEGKTFVIGEDNRIYYYDFTGNDFKQVAGLNLDRDSIYEISFVADKLLLFSHNGIYSYDFKEENGEYRGGGMQALDRTPLQFAGQDWRGIISVDAEGMLRIFNLATYVNEAVTDISGLIKTRGGISDIVTDLEDNIFISFETSGVVRLEKDHGYNPDDLGLKAGIFCMLTSRTQDVVWIGSDCQGLYTYYEGEFDIYSLNFTYFQNLISHPIRSVTLDDKGTLWLGTKGDGLLQVNDFDPRTGHYGSLKLHTSSNSPLKHNMVFSTAKSSKERMWIGTEEGINIYDYRSGQIRDVNPGVRLRWIHGLYEQDDSILWIASIGQGIWRGVIDPVSETPVFKSIRQYTLNNGDFSSNYFFSLSVDDEGSPVFSNRGLGAVVFDKKHDNLRIIDLKGDYQTCTVNDVFATSKEGEDYWLGTGHGLMHITPEGEEALFYGPERGFSNSTIHSLLKSKDGDLWLATNKGLVRFNPVTAMGNLYEEHSGVHVTEFSDGAAYKVGDDIMIFGGIDGLTIVSPDTSFVDDSRYHPRTYLAGLQIGGEKVDPIGNFSEPTLQLTLSYEQPYFTLFFSSPDFVNSYNSGYSYSLDGEKWIANGQDNSWSFTNMSPGDHKLYVKYVNLKTGVEGDPLIINLCITPPWYLSTAAKVIYVVILLALVAGLIYLLLRRQRRHQQKAVEDIKAAHKEEVYEEKLKFFTNITHEFCTPLTLIYGPCERILSYEGSDDYVRKYVGLIRSNTQRLNNLIQEIIDFRRIETGNNRRKVRHIDVSDLCKDIIESFSDLAERNNVTVINQISPDIVWNTDYRSISKIITNLVSNAFKYTAPGGTVKIGLEEKGGNLVLTVYNTGKGIAEKDKARVFNHYAILDNVEEKATKGLSARNGLGMAICHSMVDILEGTIEIDSVVGSYACFIVTLPQLQLDPDETGGQQVNPAPTIPLVESVTPAGSKKNDRDTESREAVNPDDCPVRKGAKVPRLLIVDDNEEMLTLLADSLSEYDVITATDGKDAIQRIIDSMPDLVITDIMMPGTDGLELTRQIKSNRHTMHVPLIILSAKNSNEEIVEGIQNGADVYISKPFSFSYLRAVIARLLDYNSKLREYYSSSASAYEYTGGQLMGKEDKEFIDRIKGYIDDNIDNSDLSPDSLAQFLNISTRNLYRKFKELDQVPPNDFIKAHRISFAARLLRTTSLTIQEIMYRSGFSNRSHFYKEFDKRFDMTPREYRTKEHKKDESLTEEPGTGGGE